MRVERAAAAIRAGGVVAVPTDTLYGLAADPFNPLAVERLFAVKGRARDRAVALIAADVSQVVEQLSPLTPAARRLADRFWPGPLTLLLDAPSTLADGIRGESGRVGVRVPAHAVAQALCRAVRRPLTATSANLTGQDATDDPDAVARSLGTAIDVLLDAGKTAGGAPSTIVDVTGDVLRLVRPGAIPWEEVQACVEPA